MVRDYGYNFFCWVGTEIPKFSLKTFVPCSSNFLFWLMYSFMHSTKSVLANSRTNYGTVPLSTRSRTQLPTNTDCVALRPHHSQLATKTQLIYCSLSQPASKLVLSGLEILSGVQLRVRSLLSILFGYSPFHSNDQVK